MQESARADDAPMRSTAGVPRGRPRSPIAAGASARIPVFPDGSMAALVSALMAALVTAGTGTGRVAPGLL